MLLVILILSKLLAVIISYTPMVRLYTVNMAHVTYWCSQAISNSIESLLDGEANGGLAVTDVHMLEYTE